ncbi:alpha/beta hydrolase [Pseudaminobacter sp. 19-2017]|uniref:Alpha/beta hydrolase n=1 Tax=Pseudaminobacter soli (ex Zhang et al. 2022) TaxID=2831468 RepID=A0A942DWN4_9HYPH|nr:alpha/beta hydrolase [Pseudaminobacter soli]MBS3649149.1 alpha/beta hydrolase [Pseudaminobacter soli]
MPFDARTVLFSPTGAQLNLYIKRAAEHAIGVVHINHGLAEHAARYARFAEALAGAGFHVYAHDHRGHGETTAPGAPEGRFAQEHGVDKMLADVSHVHHFISQEHPGLPLIIFGHSMGGIVALNSVLKRSDHLAGAAIWNANFSPGLLGRLGQALLGWERFRLGADVPARIVPRLTFQAWNGAVPNRRTSADWLSRDQVEVDKYVADSLCGWLPSVSMWQDIFRMVFTGADDRNFASIRRNLPFHLVGGGADPSTNFGKAVEQFAARMRRMGFSNLTSRTWPQTRHEGLNDLNRDEITADFIKWATKVVRMGTAVPENAAR